MQNYAKLQARDRGDSPFRGIAVPFPALAANTNENTTTSSALALNPNTTVVEIAAVTTPVAFKWTTQAASASVVTSSILGVSFDNIVAAGTVRQFVVPRNTQALSSSYSSIVGLNVQEGLFNAIAFKTATTLGSVLLTQY